MKPGVGDGVKVALGTQSGPTGVAVGAASCASAPPAAISVTIKHRTIKQRMVVPLVFSPAARVS
ncbi:MAG: hypothetical protein DWB42_05920 [Chloroflexi bacterium]|nr:hypothetical protein [Chloroflexota bacterium]